MKGKMMSGRWMSDIKPNEVYTYLEEKREQGYSMGGKEKIELCDLESGECAAVLPENIDSIVDCYVELMTIWCNNDIELAKNKIFIGASYTKTLEIMEAVEKKLAERDDQNDA